MAIEFKKAERTQVKLKLALTGPSGSGKTYSALLLATGMGKRVALIDTENQSAALYSDLTPFDILPLEPPYTIQKYLAGIAASESLKYDVLIIDSISHAWAGDGGLLSKKEALDSRGGNSYTNWAGISKEHEVFKAALLAANIHIICTMRSKQDYVLEINDKGKQAPKKIGLAPIQRDGMEYEFTTVFDIAMDHKAIASKDRTGLFDGLIFKICEDTGKILLTWLSTAKEAIPIIKSITKKLEKSKDLPPGDYNAAMAAIEVIKDFDMLEKIKLGLKGRQWKKGEMESLEELLIIKKRNLLGQK